MAKDYEVGNPRLDTEISDTGTGFAKVWEVPYTVTDGPAAGTRGHVRIPTANYTADNVHSAIRSAVDTHHEVMSG
jgi:hypothetical protein